MSRRRKSEKQKVAVCSGGFSFFVGDSRSLRTYKPTTRNSVKENLLLPLHTPRMYSEKEFLLFQSALKKEGRNTLTEITLNTHQASFVSQFLKRERPEKIPFSSSLPAHSKEEREKEGNSNWETKIVGLNFESINIGPPFPSWRFFKEMIEKIAFTHVQNL